jgi:hypothetical protein
LELLFFNKIEKFVVDGRRVEGTSKDKRSTSYLLRSSGKISFEPIEFGGNCSEQVCQMLYQYWANNTNLFFWWVLEWKMVCWNVLRPSGILFGVLVYFVVIWCMFPVLVYLVVIWCTYVSRFGILYQEKSGNPGRERKESSFP